MNVTLTCVSCEREIVHNKSGARPSYCVECRVERTRERARNWARVHAEERRERQHAIERAYRDRNRELILQRERKAVPVVGMIPNEPGRVTRNQHGTWRLTKPITRTRNYPPDDELVALMVQHGEFSAVARIVGVSRESLRDYLRVRPGLDRRMRSYLRRRLTTAEKRERRRAASREHRRKARLAEPDTVRALRRLSMAGNKPPGKKPALDPATNDYARVLRADPCAYCGGPMGDIDHIVPVRASGELGWTNLTAACASCNRRKRTRSLLFYLLAAA